MSSLSLERPQPTGAIPFVPAGPCTGLHRSRLALDRSDIVFYNTAPDLVRIEITLRNRGAEPSEPTLAHVSAAPFGAFVRWQPLLTLPVPALRPGESATLHAEAARPLPGTERSALRFEPGKLLTAKDAEEPRRTASRLDSILRAFGLGGILRESLETWQSALPPDPNDAPDRVQLHWAGNLNIFIGGQSVERHMAMSLRVVPEHVNFARFVVGDGPDAYAFDVAGEVRDWSVNLQATRCGRSFSPGPPIPFGSWVEFSGRRVLALLVRPPQGCRAGRLEVHVRQRSTDRKSTRLNSSHSRASRMPSSA